MTSSSPLAIASTTAAIVMVIMAGDFNKQRLLMLIFKIIIMVIATRARDRYRKAETISGAPGEA